MNKAILIITLCILNFCFTTLKQEFKCFSAPLSGSIKEDQYLIKGKKNVVVDISSGKPISNAKISIPAKNINTITDSNGNFFLDADLNGPSILSVKANGYTPFSLTINQDALSSPLTLGISKSGKEIVIDSSLHHLGDDNYSSDSANSEDFQARALGPSFSKNFFVGNIANNSNYSLKIGSIIGLDTEIARILGQSRSRSFSTSARVYLNDRKIGEIKINGDNQSISVPNQLLTSNAHNQITIITGKNIQPRSFIDYDDMEIMNLILEVK